MRIQSAIRKAIRTGKHIRRKSSKYGVALIPTNTPDDLIVVDVISNGPPAKWWHPSADDLLASDWEIC